MKGGYRQCKACEVIRHRVDRARRAPSWSPPPTLPGEEWRAIPRFPGYEASSFGRVRSINRTLSFVRNGGVVERRYHAAIAAQRRDRQGYLRVNVVRGDNRKTSQVPVHRLVAEAFHGMLPSGLETCHNDGNRLNNRPENLRYDTSKANHGDMTRHGTRRVGEAHSGAKLSNAAVLWARENRGKASVGEMARQLGVGSSTLSNAINGKAWRHVQAPAYRAVERDFPETWSDRRDM